jgi:hypothetical protein
MVNGQMGDKKGRFQLESARGTANQRALIAKTYTDSEQIGRILPALFSYVRTDAYPFASIDVTFDDGSHLPSLIRDETHGRHHNRPRDHRLADFPRRVQERSAFPEFYGRNMDAWIDCMTSVDAAEGGLSSVTVASGEILVLRIDVAFGFRRRCPEQYAALVECSAFVNFRRTESGKAPVLALLPNGR